MALELKLIIGACAMLAGSGLPGLLLPRRSGIGQWLAAALNLAGSGLGGFALLIWWSSGASATETRWDWAFPGSHLAVGIDGLSALFLIPMLLISALGSIYGLQYWAQRRHPGNGRKLRLWWGLLTAGMMGVVVARDGVVLLMAWEIMALSAYFVVTTEAKKAEVRWAGWVYLVATHMGTLSLFALFALLRMGTGSFGLWGGIAVSGGLGSAVFILGMVGFGLKAGLMPLHVWLPGAHANAPSHVSAMMSGVLLKAGVYGIIRVAGLMDRPPIWWGATLIVVGIVSGILGIAFAVAQQDFKRLLAYSSIENIGIITIGIGLAVLGKSLGHEAWVVLGMGGALLHVLNHSFFKPLLFMGAGSMLHAAHTRRIDLLGGLGKGMPRTFGLVLIGAVAICGLPPLNGFVSEWLIYVGLFRTVGTGPGGAWIWGAIAAPALALVGALALATFVKLVGAAFMGTPRSRRAEHAHDPGALMIGPMAVLAACCGMIGLAPILLAGFVQRAIAVWDQAALRPENSIRELAPLGWVSGLGIALVAAAGLGALAVRWMMRGRTQRTAGTWGCGYVRSTPRIQYTASSFGQMLVDLFGWVLRPSRIKDAVRGLFPRPARFESQVPDVVLDRGLVPGFTLLERILAWARPAQGGAVQFYLLYLLAAVMVLLLFAAW